MASSRLILNAPGDPNLDELVNSTFAAFELLRPWCGVNDGSVVKSALHRQALFYVEAIDLSISAAQDGFNITQDILIFSELVNKLDEQGLQCYLRELVKHAESGRCNAVAAQAHFRGVRSTMEKLIKEAKKEIKEDCNAARSTSVSVTIDRELDNLKTDIVTLEKFLDHISVYVAWWNVLEMEHATQRDRSSTLIVDYQSLRDTFVLNKWKILKQKYVEYTVKIREYQDSNPEFSAYREAGRVLLQHESASESKARIKRKRDIIKGFIPISIYRAVFSDE